MKVIAAPGLLVPMEHNPRVYITDDVNSPVEIEHSHYYVRRLADGDLVEWPEADAAKVTKLAAPKKTA